MKVFNDIENAFSLENFGYLLLKCKRQAIEIGRLHTQIKDLKRIITKLGAKRKNGAIYIRDLQQQIEEGSNDPNH